MRYEIYLGDTALYGVDSVGVEAGREVAVYDGVQAGKFSQPQSRALRKWSIQCELTERNDRRLAGWLPASEIFEELAEMLESKRAARLVIRSDYGKSSERVLLESVSKDEVASGVYAVKLGCVEHVVAAVKTAAVPYVSRPGTTPPLPKTVTVTSKNAGTFLSDLEKAAADQASADADANGRAPKPVLKKRGKPVTNPATVREGETLVLAWEDMSATVITEQERENGVTQKIIGNTYENYGSQ